MQMNTLAARVSTLSVVGLMHLGTVPAAQAQWTVTNLHPPGLSQSYAYGTGNGQQVGLTYATVAGTPEHAALWSGSSGSWIDLHPAGSLYSEAFSASGGQQVGTVGVAGSGPHASLWSGSSESWVDLSPGAGVTIANALGVFGGQQVGHVDYHASLWSGSAASRVDLNPGPGFSSFAYGTSGTHQVGCFATVDHGHFACVWSGSAESWIDLHPEGASQSIAFGVSGSQQVGRAMFGGAYRACLWTGSAASWADLTPADAIEAEAYGVFDGVQVGYANFAGNPHAGIWTGSASSWEDLHVSLPPEYDFSFALGIWSDASRTYVAGWGQDGSIAQHQALLWTRFRADYDGNGTVNSEDFFSFLSAFFAESAAADFNHDGVVTSQDFFDFLMAFFTP